MKIKKVKEHIICALANLDDLEKIIKDRCLIRAKKELEEAVSELSTLAALSPLTALSPSIN